MAGCAEGIWALQDVVQPFYPVGQDGYIRQDLAKAVQVQDENLDDGRNPFKSTQDGGKPKKRRSSIWHIGRTKGGLGSKLHALCYSPGRPVRLLLTAGNVSDAVGVAELLKDLPKADYSLADKGYDAHWFREELKRRGIEPCIPSISMPQRPTALGHEPI